MFVDNLKVDVIATYENHEQDHFNCGVWESAIKSEKKLIDYIKEQLRHKDLVKLSLCWECSKELTFVKMIAPNSIDIRRDGWYNGRKEND